MHFLRSLQWLALLTIAPAGRAGQSGERRFSDHPSGFGPCGLKPAWQCQQTAMLSQRDGIARHDVAQLASASPICVVRCKPDLVLGTGLVHDLRRRLRSRRQRASSTVGARRQTKYRQRAISLGSFRSRRPVYCPLLGRQGIGSGRLACASSAPSVHSADGCNLLAARPIASQLQKELPDDGGGGADGAQCHRSHRRKKAKVALFIKFVKFLKAPIKLFRVPITQMLEVADA